MLFLRIGIAEQNQLFWPQICQRATEFAEKNTSAAAIAAAKLG
jgi:hypothetical protein